MKRTLSFIFVIILVMCLGLSIAYAAPVILPESADTPIVIPNSGGTIINNSTGNSSGGIVIIDPDTNKPVQTPVPVQTYQIVDVAPSVLKNPTGESVDAGSEVVFVARADTATSVTWYLTNGDTYIPASEVGNHFTGVSSTGAETERLVLSNVSDKMDGWSAVARFDNAVGSTWSGQAKLSVAPDPNAAPSPTPTPMPTATVNPTPTPVPANMPNGTGSTATQHGLNNQNLTPGSNVGNSNNTSIGNTGNNVDVNTTTGVSPIQTTSAGNGSAGSARNSHVGAYILAAVAGLVIIGSVVVMALYMKGLISLGKFEKFLGSFGNDNDADMFDNSGEFYNPDDFKDKNDKT